jgi:hypothetical protein
LALDVLGFLGSLDRVLTGHSSECISYAGSAGYHHVGSFNVDFTACPTTKDDDAVDKRFASRKLGPITESESAPVSIVYRAPIPSTISAPAARARSFTQVVARRSRTESIGRTGSGVKAYCWSVPGRGRRRSDHHRKLGYRRVVRRGCGASHDRMTSVRSRSI